MHHLIKKFLFPINDDETNENWIELEKKNLRSIRMNGRHHHDRTNRIVNAVKNDRAGGPRLEGLRSVAALQAPPLHPYRIETVGDPSVFPVP